MVRELESSKESTRRGLKLAKELNVAMDWRVDNMNVDNGD